MPRARGAEEPRPQNASGRWLGPSGSQPSLSFRPSASLPLSFTPEPGGGAADPPRGDLCMTVMRETPQVECAAPVAGAEKA